MLVELAAQSAELDHAAELAGVDHLVEAGREHAIGERLAARRQIARRLERRLDAALLVGAALGVGFLLPALLVRAGLVLVLGAGRGLALAPGLLVGILAFALARLLALIRLLGRGLGVRGIGSLLVGILAQLLGEAELCQHLPHVQPELLLARELAAQPAPVLAGLAVEPAAPALEGVALALAELEAEQALQRVELERLGELGLGTVGGELGRASAPQAVRRGEIGGDARHAARPQRLDPDLLERLEDGGRDLAAGREPVVDLGVVMAQAERDAVRLAPHPGHVATAHLAPRQRQAHVRTGAAGAGLLACLTSPKAHGEPRLVGHGAKRRGDRALEGVELVLARQRQDPASTSA
jgi:hypothetical protein